MACASLGRKSQESHATKALSGEAMACASLGRESQESHATRALSGEATACASLGRKSQESHATRAPVAKRRHVPSTSRCGIRLNAAVMNACRRFATGAMWAGRLGPGTCVPGFCMPSLCDCRRCGAPSIAYRIDRSNDSIGCCFASGRCARPSSRRGVLRRLVALPRQLLCVARTASLATR